MNHTHSFDPQITQHRREVVEQSLNSATYELVTRSGKCDCGAWRTVKTHSQILADLAQACHSLK